MKKLISTLGALMICVTIIPIVTVSANYKNNEYNSDLKRSGKNQVYKQKNTKRTIDKIHYEHNLFSHNYLFLDIDNIEINRLKDFKKFHPSDKDAFLNFAYSLISGFRNWEGVGEHDIEIIANTIVKNFNDIENVFSKNPNNGLNIRTNTVGYWPPGGSKSDNWWGAHKDPN